MKKRRIVIEIEGGAIQSITSDGDIDIVLLDKDTDGADNTTIIELPPRGHFAHEDAEVIVPAIAGPDFIRADFVDEVFRQVKACNP